MIKVWVYPKKDKIKILDVDEEDGEIYNEILMNKAQGKELKYRLTRLIPLMD